jgi:hypothetical protein
MTEIAAAVIVRESEGFAEVDQNRLRIAVAHWAG